MDRTIIFQFFSLKPLCQSKPKFIWSLLGKETKFSINDRGGVVDMTKIHATPYIITTFKFVVIRTKSLMFVKHGMNFEDSENENDMTLTYFRAW